jgi:RNA polymerase sigma factor (TIGR02999 family)
MEEGEGKQPGEITLLLTRAQQGDKLAEERLAAAVYGELRKIAAAYLRRERPDHSLQPTALVNEAYLKLADLNRLRWQDRSHFFGVAARIMRQVLVDHARARLTEKRGRDYVVVPITKHLMIDPTAKTQTGILALHDALEALERKDPRAVRVIECRFFTGLSIEETAEALGIAERTVKRDWQIGRAWLRRELARSSQA